MIALPRQHRFGRRPANFRLDMNASFAQGLVFAGLGQHIGSTHYHDQSDYKNHGVLTNMDPATDWVWSSELNRFAVDFAGAGPNEAIDCGTEVLAPSRLTLACWHISPTIQTHGMSPIRRDKSYLIHVTAGKQLGGAVWQGGSIKDWPQVLSAVLNDGQLYHHAFTFDGDYYRLYTDGVLVDSHDTSATGIDAAALESLCIGDKFVGGGNNFNGSIFDPCVWDRALTPSEIAILADRSDPMLGGLIQPIPSRRFFFPAPAAGGLSIPIAMHHYQQIGAH